MNELPNMIQGGAFGSYGPMNTYNPYQQNNYYNQYPNQMQNYNGYYNNAPNNNMISFGGSYQTPYQQQGFVFQPVQQYQQPRQDNYYDPYGTMRNQNYYNPYGIDYNYNGGYNNYYQQQQYQTVNSMQTAYNNNIEVAKAKLRGLNKFMGREMSEEELDRMFNPQNQANVIPQEKIEEAQEYNMLRELDNRHKSGVWQPTTYQVIAANRMKEYVEEFNRFNKHSAYEYFAIDLPQLAWKQWLEDNTISLRNMQGTYDSRQYNELLNMHRSSNPMVNQLLDESRYDNNRDDYEIGMNAAMERERRRQQILNGGVPEFISSPETQKQRADWTKELMNQIYNKEVISTNV